MKSACTSDISRRSFLKTAGVTVGTGLALGASLPLSGCVADKNHELDAELNEAPADPAQCHVMQGQAVSFEHGCEVLIVGSGIAGLSAAIEPLADGKRVLLVEKLDILGGDSYRSCGLFYGAGTRLQQNHNRSANIDEAWAARRAELLGSHTPTQALSLQKPFYAQRDWLNLIMDSYGAQFAKPDSYLEEDDKRGLLIPQGGIGNMDAVMIPLRDKLHEQGLQTLTSLSAEAFIFNADDEIKGMRFVSTQDGKFVDISASKVILCCAGYIANQALVHKHLPDWTFVPCLSFSSQGSTQKLAQSIGAAQTALEDSISLIADIPNASAWSLVAPTIAVNAQAKRFCNEDSLSEAADKTFRNQAGFWWTIFDEQLVKSVQGPHVAKTLTEHTKRAFGPFDHIEDLARAADLNAEQLKRSLDDYNSMVTKGSIDDFGRSYNRKPLHAPFWALRLSPARYEAHGGIDIDDAGRCLNQLRQPIKNLFAAGRATNANIDGLTTAGMQGWLAGKRACEELNQARQERKYAIEGAREASKTKNRKTLSQ